LEEYLFILLMEEMLRTPNLLGEMLLAAEVVSF